ncbi:MAG: caspase family protein [Desulfobacterales bacterium]|nr:caspase family protein [Desulfobacterales bacterium]
MLAVGVNHLEHIPGNDLRFPAKDAREITKRLTRLKGRLFKKVHAHIFSDDTSREPVSGDIVDALYALRKARAEDTVMIFLAGHGVTTRDNDYIFLTRDAKQYGDGSYKMSSVLKWDDVDDVLGKVNARRIVFLDTCYSGGSDISELLKRGSDSNFAVFASSSGEQVSIESEGLGHGFFTYAILQGLSRGLPADMYKDGRVEITELSVYVKGEVKKLSHGRQTPNLALPRGVDDFPFYVE